MSEKKPSSRTTYLVREVAGIAIAGIGIAEGLKLSKTHYNRGVALSSGALTAGLWLYLYSDSQVKSIDDPDRWILKSAIPKNEGLQPSVEATEIESDQQKLLAC